MARPKAKRDSGLTVRAVILMVFVATLLGGACFVFLYSFSQGTPRCQLRLGYVDSWRAASTLVERIQADNLLESHGLSVQLEPFPNVWLMNEKALDDELDLILTWDGPIVPFLATTGAWEPMLAGAPAFPWGLRFAGVSADRPRRPGHLDRLAIPTEWGLQPGLFTWAKSENIRLLESSEAYRPGEGITPWLMVDAAVVDSASFFGDAAADAALVPEPDDGILKLDPGTPFFCVRRRVREQHQARVNCFRAAWAKLATNLTTGATVATPGKDLGAYPQEATGMYLHIDHFARQNLGSGRQLRDLILGRLRLTEDGNGNPRHCVHGIGY